MPATGADDDAAGVLKDLDRLSEPQVFRRAGEGDNTAACLTRECLLQFSDRTHRQLRRDKHNRAVLQVRKQRFFLTKHGVDIGTVLLVYGRVVADPDDIRIRDGSNIDAEGESAGSETRPDQFSKPRLVEWRLALR